jgi:hypothetical protein
MSSDKKVAKTCPREPAVIAMHLKVALVLPSSPLVHGVVSWRIVVENASGHTGKPTTSSTA